MVVSLSHECSDTPRWPFDLRAPMLARRSARGRLSHRQKHARSMRVHVYEYDIHDVATLEHK